METIEPSLLDDYQKNGNIILLTAQDIARILQISKSMAYHLLQTGQIRTVKIGRTVRVRPADLDHFIQDSLVK